MDERGDGLAAEAEGEAAARAAPRACSCGVVDVAPWRGHDLPWSPASVIFGAFTLAAAVAAVGAAPVLWVGPLILAIWLGATVATTVLARKRGHLGWCLARRGVWMGVAAIGIALRVLAGLPF